MSTGPYTPAAVLTPLTPASPSRHHDGVRSPQAPGLEAHRLRLLSYNVQTGIASARYRHYLTNSWRHLVPHPARQLNLDRIASSGLDHFDVVGLQEIDAGSMRTSFVNQARYLAERAGFPYWHVQTNRRLGNLARHSNGVLARLRPREVADYKLPGLPGRGALLARFGRREHYLALFVVHLALGRRARIRQLDFLAELTSDHRNVVMMGDFNCTIDSPEMRRLVRNTALFIPDEELHTFPSWQPLRRIDHILVSPSIDVRHAYVPKWLVSDHLPIAMEVDVPLGMF